MLRGFAVAALFSSLTLLQAAEREWTAASTDHFELITTGGARKAKAGIQHFEEVRDFFVRALGFDPKLRQKVRLIAFDSLEEWKRYRPNEVAAAFYIPIADRDTIAMESLRGEIYPTAVHEFVHLLLSHSGGTFPIWLNEGLAELYSSMNLQGNKMRVGDLHLGRYQLLQRSKWLSMEQLVAVDHSSPIYNTKSHAGIFYSQSWALVHMVMLGDAYRPNSGAFVKKVAFEDVPAAKAFADVYGKTLFQVQKDLEGYLAASSIKIGLVTYKPEKPIAPEIRPATRFEADLARAQLLSRSEDARDAEEIFQRLEAENAHDLALAEAYAFHFLYKEKREHAQPRFERAVNAGSTNPKVYMQYAFLVQQESPDKAVAAMRKAVEFEPGDKVMRYYLGRMLLAAKKPGEALSTLTDARPLPPEHVVGYLSALAEVYLAFKKPDQARLAVNRAMALAKTDGERAQASSLLRYVSQWETFLEEEKNAAADNKAAAERYRQYQEERAKAAATSTTDNSADEAAAPTLRRRGAPESTVTEAAAPSAYTRVTGNLRMVECRGQQAILQVVTASGAKPRRFLIEDPGAVTITGTDALTVEFSCGPQKNLPVTIGIVAGVEAKTATEGLVRTIGFH